MIYVKLLLHLCSTQDGYIIFRLPSWFLGQEEVSLCKEAMNFTVLVHRQHYSTRPVNRFTPVCNIYSWSWDFIALNNELLPIQRKGQTWAWRNLSQGECNSWEAWSLPSLGRLSYEACKQGQGTRFSEDTWSALRVRTATNRLKAKKISDSRRKLSGRMPWVRIKIRNKTYI